MKTISNVKHYIQKSAVVIVAGAALIIPGATAIAHGRGDGRGHVDQDRRASQHRQARAQPKAHTQRFAVSAQRGSWNDKDDNQRNGNWWGDWRFNNDRNDPDPDSCEARQANANKQTDRLKRASQYLLGRLSRQIDAQKQYVAKHDLSPDSFDALVATADTDKASAQVAIDALQAPQIDCEQDKDTDTGVLQSNKAPVIEALRIYNIDAVNVSYAVQAAR